MRCATLLLFFTLKSSVALANPIIDKEDFLEDNSIMQGTRTFLNDATASITPYTCVYIPPDLDICDFIGYDRNENLQNLEHKLSEKRKRMLLKGNNMYFTSRPSMRVPRMEKLLKQKPVKPVKTIIYEIQRCVPLRLPFIYPTCNDHDLSNKKSEIRQLYPFVPKIRGKDSSNVMYEFPMSTFSKQIPRVSKSI